MNTAPETEWSTREKLAIASYVLRSGEQHWSGVARLLRPLGEPGRPPDWFSPKYCAQQYTALLGDIDVPKRKRGTSSENNESTDVSSPLSIEETIVRGLTQDRIDELKKQIRDERTQYRNMKKELEMIDSGGLDDKLDELLEQYGENDDDDVPTEQAPRIQESESQKVPSPVLSPTGERLVPSSNDCDMTDIELADDQQSNCIAEEVKNELRKMNIPLTMQVNQDIQTTPEETSRIGQDFDIKEENMEDSPVGTLSTSEIQVTAVHNSGNTQRTDTEGLLLETSDIASATFDTTEEEPPAICIDNQTSPSVVESANPSIKAIETILTESLSSQADKNISDDKSSQLINEIKKDDEFLKLDHSAQVLVSDRSLIEGKEPNSRDRELDEQETAAEISECLNTVREGEDSKDNSEETSSPKLPAVEDTICADRPEDSESLYNESLDERSQGAYSQSISLPSTPLPYSQCTSDSFPASPALSHSSDIDPDQATNWKAWRKSIMILWKQVASHRYASLFLQPVTDDIAPNYSTTVCRSMDLSTIKKNIEGGVIRATSEFQRDLMLMFQNAIMYNSCEHDVYKMTTEMQKDVMDQVAQFLATQLMVETAVKPNSNKSLRRSTMRRSAFSEKVSTTVGHVYATPDILLSVLVSEARSKRVAAIEGEAKLMRKKQPSHE